MILARHAEALFWAGRQVERTEQAARLLDVCGRNAMHIDAGSSRRYWSCVIDVLGLAPLVRDLPGGDGGNGVDHLLFVDRSNPGSVLSALHDLRENIRTVRDRVPVELWEETNRLHVQLSGEGVLDALSDEPAALHSAVRRGCQAITGVVAEAMQRDAGYTFFVVGRMVDRSVFTCRVLRLALLGAPDLFDASAVLRSVSSLQAYRRAEGYDDSPERLVHFLLTAADVPRTVLSCLRQAGSRLATLEIESTGVAPARRVCGRLVAELEFGDVEADVATDPIECLTAIEADVVDLGSLLSTHAFSPAQASPLSMHAIRPGDDR